MHCSCFREVASNAPYDYGYGSFIESPYRYLSCVLIIHSLSVQKKLNVVELD